MLRAIIIVLACGVTAGGSTASANWSDAFGPPGFSGQARAVVHHDGEVIVGGTFRWSGSAQVNHITRWDGTRWRALGGGTDGAVPGHGGRERHTLASQMTIPGVFGYGLAAMALDILAERTDR